MTPEPTALALHSFDGAGQLGHEAERARTVIEARRVVVDQFLRAAVTTLPDSVGRIAGNHLGWLDENGDPAVVVALTSGTAASCELAKLYHRDSELPDEELARAADLIEEAGAQA